LKDAVGSIKQSAIERILDRHDFGRNPSKIMDVIESKSLDHFLAKLNRTGIPLEVICDSCSVLVKGASMDGWSLFAGFAEACDRNH